MRKAGAWAVLLILLTATALLVYNGGTALTRAAEERYHLAVNPPSPADWHSEGSVDHPHRPVHVENASNGHPPSTTASATTTTTTTTTPTAAFVLSHGHVRFPVPANITVTSRGTVSENARRTWRTNSSALPEIRAEVLRKTCKKLGMKTKFNRKLKNGGFSKFIANEQHQLLFCPIQKVGSSFWKRVFRMLNFLGDRNVSLNTSVFDLSSTRIHKFASLKSMNMTVLKRHPDFFRTAQKILFVRDPYERLFSGFIDKIFTPTFETKRIVSNILPAKNVLKKRSLRRSYGNGYGLQGDAIFRKHDPEAVMDDNEALPHRSDGNDTERRHRFQRFEKQNSDKHKLRIILLQDNDRNRRSEDVNERRWRRENGFNMIPDRASVSLRHNINSRKMPDFGTSRRISKHVLDMRDSDGPPRNGGHSNAHDGRCKTKRVTFTDFIRYVVRGHLVNVHFQPMSQACPPCLLPYQFLGKLETFREDVRHILTSVGIDPASVLWSESTFDDDSDLSILRDVTMRTFSIIQNQRACITKAEMLFRTWTTFQIRGFLSINQSFPLTGNECDNVTQDQFLDIVSQAFHHSGPRQQRMRQRKAAMLEAFYGLPRSLMKRLESYVMKDCQLFGYECSVEARFNPGYVPEAMFHFGRLMKHAVSFES